MDIEIVKAAKNGDNEAFEKILKKLKPLIYFQNKRIFFVGGDKDDIMQEISIGLFYAIRSYKEDRGASFTSFALLCIKRHLITKLRGYNSRRNRILNNAILISTEDKDENFLTLYKSYIYASPEELCLCKEKIKELKKYLKQNLTSIESEIYQYLIFDMNYITIAAKTGRTRKSVDNAIQRIRQKIKFFLSRY